MGFGNTRTHISLLPFNFSISFLPSFQKDINHGDNSVTLIHILKNIVYRILASSSFYQHFKSSNSM